MMAAVTNRPLTGEDFYRTIRQMKDLKEPVVYGGPSQTVALDSTDTIKVKKVRIQRTRSTSTNKDRKTKKQKRQQRRQGRGNK